MTLGLWTSALTMASATVVGLVLFSPRVARSERWRATVTPLASIIGSGFLVLGPILLRDYGRWAPAVMLALCAVAYAFGSAIRSNIRHFEPEAASRSASPLALRLDRVSSWALAAAYVVSVAYYLNLLGAFAVSLTPVDDRLAARLVTTAVFCFIGVYGFRHGLARLEVLEEGAVGLKLSIIAGLTLGLGCYAARLAIEGRTVDDPTHVAGLRSLFVAFGLVITVQGFETSRYLGEEHDGATRIRTMRAAQWISTAIYVVYVALMSVSFSADGIGESETAIIGVAAVVAPVLPAMLVTAALAAQFSAAVADTAGCGGLVHEISGGRWTARVGYASVVGGGLLLTWSADVFEIITFASRAFAVYYALQCGVAATSAYARGARGPSVAYASLAGLACVIAAFGVPVE